MVSTGVLKFEERAAAGTALKNSTFKLNTNKNLAGAKDAVNGCVFDVDFQKQATYSTLLCISSVFAFYCKKSTSKIPRTKTNKNICFSRRKGAGIQSYFKPDNNEKRLFLSVLAYPVTNISLLLPGSCSYLKYHSWDKSPLGDKLKQAKFLIN